MTDYKPQSICCCLLPRPGIMVFAATYGLWYFGSIVFEIIAYGTIRMYNHVIPEDSSMEMPEGDLLPQLSSLENATRVMCASIYFYAFFLAYKRKWKALESIVYVLVVTALFDIYLLYGSLKVMVKAIMNFSNEDVPDGHGVFIGIIAATTLLFHVIPLITQVYIINQIRSYVKYLLYKKDMKVSSSSAD
ncbi:hypothetical protein BC941DRAFT_497983 [Chlamydoabsidia padenii]|nr:hypothetical protein BC941DRAFT_497983 [Chlamydoabsidia padenii]